MAKGTVYLTETSPLHVYEINIHQKLILLPKCLNKPLAFGETLGQVSKYQFPGYIFGFYFFWFSSVPLAWLVIYNNLQSKYMTNNKCILGHSA